MKTYDLGKVVGDKGEPGQIIESVMATKTVKPDVDTRYIIDAANITVTLEPGNSIEEGVEVDFIAIYPFTLVIGEDTVAIPNNKIVRYFYDGENFFEHTPVSTSEFTKTLESYTKNTDTLSELNTKSNKPVNSTAVNSAVKTSSTEIINSVEEKHSAAMAEIEKKLDKENGVAKNLEVTENLTVNGDIIQNGEAYETHAEKVYTKNNMIFTRDGAVSALADGEVTGIEAQKYDGENNGHLVFDKTGEARVGDVGDTQPLLTREEAASLADGQFFKWDATNRKAIGKTLAEVADELESRFYNKQSVDELANNIIRIKNRVFTSFADLQESVKGFSGLRVDCVNIENSTDILAPVTTQNYYWWNVITYGVGDRQTQIANQVYHSYTYTNSSYTRTYHDNRWSNWIKLA